MHPEVKEVNKQCVFVRDTSVTIPHDNHTAYCRAKPSLYMIEHPSKIESSISFSQNLRYKGTTESSLHFVNLCYEIFIFYLSFGTMFLYSTRKIFLPSSEFLESDAAVADQAGKEDLASTTPNSRFRRDYIQGRIVRAKVIGTTACRITQLVKKRGIKNHIPV